MSNMTLKGGLLAAAVSLAAGSVQAEEVWKVQSLWSAGTINQAVFEKFAADLTKASDGRLTVEPLPVRSVVAHNETLDAVGADILQGQHTASVYFSGRDAAFAMIGDLNAAYENPYQMEYWFYYRGGLELAREVYAQHNLFYVGPIWWGVESIPVSKPVRSIDDFAGVKLRMPEGPSSDIFNKIGAAPVNIPGSEVYTSLERGVIDGTDWGTLSMNQDLGYHAIAQYPIYPGLHSMPMADFAINMDRWNALPDDLKTLVELSVRAFNADMIGAIAVADIEAVAKATAEGATIISWTPEERKRLRNVAAEVWKEYAGRSPLATKIYESQLAWLKELNLVD
ncbi:MAG: TRAP transporter substrate-binding protein DctP [Rhodospirillales bacterium]